MTDKEIIIDGINVAGCEDYGYRGKAGYWCHNYDEPCTDYPNCYYKQLKRKEQECNKLYIQLKSDEEYHKEDEKSLLNIIDDLQKEKNKWVEKYNDLGQDFDQLKAENEELKHEVELMMDCESCKIDEYKQTLTEIKDMCSEINCESLMQNYWCGNTDFKMGCCEKLFKKQILQKISEVENE